jgi:hypothetical protein
MNAKLSILAAVCVALFLSACGSSPQSLILGKWEMAGARVGGVDNESATAAGRAIKMSAEFNRDGTVRSRHRMLTFGQKTRRFLPI